MIIAMQLKDLYGVDKVLDHQPNTFETRQANRLFEEFMDYRYVR